MAEISNHSNALTTRRQRGQHRALSVAAMRLAAWLAFVLLSSGGAQAAEVKTQKQIFGWVERVLVTDLGVSMRGKLDTGAKTSSLHATNIIPFKRDGVAWVRYDVEAPREDRVITLESPLVRTVTIKEQGTGSSMRPIVNLWICMGEMSRVVEVNLIDRSRFNYPLLIGRTALADTVIVDPGESFTRKPTCDLPGGRP